MARRRGSAPARQPSSRSTRATRSASTRNDVPDIYQEMLVDADVQPVATSPERPLKRRRPNQRKTAQQISPSKIPPAQTEKQDEQKPVNRAAASKELDHDTDEEYDVDFEEVTIPSATVQTISRESDDSDSEEEEFEEVGLPLPNLDADPPTKDDTKELELDLSARHAAQTPRTLDRRKPINKQEKDRRVEIHQTHLLCLLAHASRRNRWCNDAAVQKSLRPLLTKKTIKYLNPETHLSQFGRTNSLKEGLKEVNTMFKIRYEITERGLRRALWAEAAEHLQNYQLPEDAEIPMEKSDFREAAKQLKGSRDVGAQLYCALLRSVGVEARLVCSLQPLSFASGGPTLGRPPKQKARPSLEERHARMPTYDSSFDSPASTTAPMSARRRLGHPSAAAFQLPAMTANVTPRPPAPVRPRIKESAHPVYWVEILDEAHQKWQPTDPLVTDSFWRPPKFEPPASDRENCMTYVVSFEEDGTAKDVTRRYAKAYNAKTRKMRVESVLNNGDKWWRRILRTYSRGFRTDIDQIEDNELNAAESKEPMPRNVADFKDHPIFALERHFRRHEVLIPNATAAGTIGVGSKGPLEKIYRRRDVRTARSREKWYRMGREVPGDEIPAKFLPKRAKPKSDLFGDEPDDQDEETVGTPIYTEEQTKLYKAAPVVNGRIPKNRFGNLDVYVPSMVPEGGSYVTDELGAQASFILGIDYAPALTGFEFKGRQGTAVLKGVVVASEHEEAVWAVIKGLKDQEAEREREKRTREVLKAWRVLLMNLRVRQRIWADVDSEAEGEAENGDTTSTLENVENTEGDVGFEAEHIDDDEVSEGRESDTGGGFIIDDDYAGGFIADD